MQTKILWASMAAVCLAACGGGGGDDVSSPPPSTSSDLSVTMSGPANPVPAGTTASFSAVVVNNGPDAATNVALTASSAGTAASAVGVTFAGCTAAGGATCPAVVGATMTVPSLPSGGQLNFVASGAVPAGTSGTLAVTLTAAAASDTTAANNSATANAAAYSTDVSVAVTPPASAVPAGGSAVFAVTVANAGPDAASDVAIVVTPGVQLTLDAASCASSGGAVCPASLGAAMTLASLPSGGQVVLTMPAVVVAGTNGPIQLTAAATAAGDAASANNSATGTGSAYSANLSVSVTGPASVAAGSTASFTGTIANAGPGDVANLEVTRSLTAGYTAGTVSCASTGGAVCPTNLATATGVIPALPVGGTLTLTIPVPVGSAQRGAIVAQLMVANEGDPVVGNNVASATITALDARSGDYVMHAASGAIYTLSFDADAATFSVTGNGLAQSGAAPFDAPSGWFVASGNVRFRTLEDVIIGGFDFGGGVIPFFAARRFVTDVTQLAGDFITLRSTRPLTGPKDSFINNVRIQNGVWQQCNDNLFYALGSCPLASQGNYPITWNGSNFLGQVSPTAAFPFRLAMSGTTPILIRANTSSTNGSTFLIGLPMNTYTTGTFEGISSAGTRETAVFGSASWSTTRVASNGNVSTDSSTLFNGIPVVPGLMVVQRASDGASIFLISSGSFAAVLGARSGPAAGYVEVLGR